MGNVICARCGKEIKENERSHQVIRKMNDGSKMTVLVCEECYQTINIRTKEKQREKKEKEKKDFKLHVKLRIILSTIAALVFLALSIWGCIHHYQTIGLAWSIVIPIFFTYAAFSDMYCIFDDTIVSEVFFGITSFSLHFPGIIFTFDLDGFIFLITMKILFAIIGIVVSLCVFGFAIILTMMISIFYFPPHLACNIARDKEVDNIKI